MPKRPESEEGSTMSHARPDKHALTPYVQEIILDLLKKGNFLSTACRASGITMRCLQYWRKGLRDGDKYCEQYRDFLEKVEQAIACSEADYLSEVEKAAKSGQWQAAAWILERRFTGNWGRKDVMELIGAKPKGFSDLSDAEVKAIRDRAHKKMRNGRL